MRSRSKSVCAELNTLSKNCGRRRYWPHGTSTPQTFNLAPLSGGGRRTHRADQRGAALHAAVGDVFKIVGCSAATEPAGSTDANIILRPHCVQGSMKLGRPDGGTSLRYMELTRFLVLHILSRDQFTEESMNICAPHKILPVGYWSGASASILPCGFTKGQPQHGRAISRHRARRFAVPSPLRAPAQETGTHSIAQLLRRLGPGASGLASATMAAAAISAAFSFERPQDVLVGVLSKPHE
jgi:hypothetical protein